ncbi:Hypothetical protein SCF082_LOCUS3378 [Durusdinium trenchii]|uniref:Uncharacterized protein n=1 Tax=Durusdinium trenchii TaxID=1381693 RepID=A0ABP0HSE0_9DINO
MADDEGGGVEDRGEMFVPAGTSGALTGVLDSHNLLAKKLLELQQARHETRAKQGFADREAIKCEVELSSAGAQQRAGDEERWQQEAKATEEQQQKVAEKMPELEDSTRMQIQFYQFLPSCPQTNQQREGWRAGGYFGLSLPSQCAPRCHRPIVSMRNVQLRSVRSSLPASDASSGDEEPGAATVGAWTHLACVEAALSLQIKKLGEEINQRPVRPILKWRVNALELFLLDEEVTSFQQGMEERMAQLEQTCQTRHEALSEEFRAVEPRLTPLLDALSQRLDATDENLVKLGERLSESKAENVSSLQDLSAQLKASAEAAEAFATKQDELVVGDFKECFNDRLKNLEGALKQSEYERLIFQDRFKTELAASTEQLQDLHRAREALHGDLAQLRTEALPPLAPLQEAQQQLRGVTAKLEEGLAACQTKAVELANSFATSAAQQSASHADLKGRVEAEVQRLETSAQVGTQQVLQTIRAGEGERLKLLEGQVVEERRERQELRARLEKEEREREGEILTCQRMAEKRAQDVELIANARFESVRQALDELVVEFQGFVKSENSRVMDVSRLEALVRALEVRVWPWRNSSKERSPSSSPRSGWDTARGGGPGGTGDWQEWLKVKKPTRPQGPQPGRPSWSQEPMTNLVVGPTNPVGPAMAAARTARVNTQEPFN